MYSSRTHVFANCCCVYTLCFGFLLQDAERSGTLQVEAALTKLSFEESWQERAPPGWQTDAPLSSFAESSMTAKPSSAGEEHTNAGNDELTAAASGSSGNYGEP